MSETITDAIARPDVDVIDASRSRRRPRSRWLKGIILLVAVFWIVSQGLSLTIRYTPLQKILATRLEAVFGRPVEVGSYDFSLWDGPTLSARSVTVGEDPQFGREYFLRAESVSVRLRWQSLLRGRIEAGTVSLVRPSEYRGGPGRAFECGGVDAAGGGVRTAKWLDRITGCFADTAFSPARSRRRASELQTRLSKTPIRVHRSHRRSRSKPARPLDHRFARHTLARRRDDPASGRAASVGRDGRNVIAASPRRIECGLARRLGFGRAAAGPRR